LATGQKSLAYMRNEIYESVDLRKVQPFQTFKNKHKLCLFNRLMLILL